MKRKLTLVAMITLLVSLPAFAGSKKHGERAMIEKMEAVPCGAKERGLTGLGSVFASVGATAINSDEKLCPQYLLRTDDLEYHIRPLDHKHPVILPIGKEGEFKITKDVMEMRVPDGDRKKRRYQVVAMKPIDHTETSNADSQNMRNDSSRKDFANPLPATQGQAARVNNNKPPTVPNSPPQ
jgi:hypothetical protein